MFQSYYMVTVAGKINYCWEDLEITCNSHSSIWKVVGFFFFPLSPFPPTLLFRNVFSHTLESGPKNPTGLQTHLEIRICHDTVWYPHLCTPTYLRLKSNPSQIPPSAFHTKFGYTELLLSEKPNNDAALSRTPCKLDSHPQKKNCRTDLGN